jgi:TonB family protein
MNFSHSTLTTILALALSLDSVVAQAFIEPNAKFEGSSAVDMKGVRHYGRDYVGLNPWDRDDLIQGYGPSYSYSDRVMRHQGVGLFRLSLDLKTGTVIKVTVLKSTGFSTLDGSAIAALRRWRWKPGKWKEVQEPVKFQLTRTGQPVPSGAIQLPQRW